ncbi:MAG: M48 family metalloprotease, partial [bacterium]
TEWIVLLHFFIAGLGAYRLARYMGVSPAGSVTAAVAFTFCGFHCAHKKHTNMLFALVWFPWLLLLVLTTAPTAGLLLQLALSRNREFDADLEAARLTGDPRGLAGALNKLEQLQGRIWERMLPPGWRLLQPALLRSHPHTGQRIARLLELAGLPPAPRKRLPLPGRLSLPGLIRPMAGF